MKTATLTVGINEESDLQISEKEYAGIYVMRELTAQEAFNALSGIEDVRAVTAAEYNRILIETATTLDGNPLKIDMKKIPQKLWSLLLVMNDNLNTMSDDEARFLLERSGLKLPRYILP